MSISVKNLLGLPVVTRSGARLGRVADCLVDSISQSIIQYEVKGSWLAVAKLLIKREQVISLEADKMIVDDAVVPQNISKVVVASAAVTPAAPSLTQNARS